MTDTGKLAAEALGLHGFLGLPRDWDAYPGIAAIDLWSGVKTLPLESAFEAWVDRFLAKPPVGKPVLLGYSLGGRLAMHLALRAPELFSKLVIVSANPGLLSEKEKSARLASDLEWANRFRTENWDRVVSAWNAQPVLKTPAGSLSLPREEKDFDREALAFSLDAWSLGRQRDLRGELETLSLPTLFVSGSEDAKFTEMMRNLKLPESAKHVVVEGAGHRVPWDRPLDFAGLLTRFLEA